MRKTIFYAQRLPLCLLQSQICNSSFSLTPSSLFSSSIPRLPFCLLQSALCNSSYSPARYRAASMIDQRWMTHPIVPREITQITPAKTNMIPALIIRPCINCPSPGMKKLANAAITFPVEPCSAIVSPIYFRFIYISTFLKNFSNTCPYPAQA